MKASVKLKIAGGFTILLIFLALTSLIGMLIANKTDKDLDDIQIRMERISLDYRMKNAFQGAALAIQCYMVYGDEKYLAEYRDQINLTKKLVAERVNNSTDQNRPIFAKILSRAEKYDKQITENMIPLLKDKKIKEAVEVGIEIAPITAEITKNLDDRVLENENKTSGLIHEVHNSAAASSKRILIISLAALMAGIVLAYLTTRSITGPVKEIMNCVKRLADGDFTREVKVKSSDEIGQLARTLNQTREQLRELLRDIVGVTQTLAAQSQELAASSEEVSATAEEVASTTNEVAAMAGKSMENANITTIESRKAVDIAKSGGEVVRGTIAKINSISQASNRANESIQKLGNLSARIGNITNVITGLADQTNLLALNAAIEAARAGDQGRGFAVVAEEVRVLAEQSSSAAKEIGSLIIQIQSGVDESISSMEEGATEVGEGVKLASKAGNALESIIEAISRNIELVEEITQGARHTSEGTQHLTGSNEQITSTIQQVAGSTQELSDLANKLQISVSMFKI